MQEVERQYGSRDAAVSASIEEAERLAIEEVTGAKSGDRDACWERVVTGARRAHGRDADERLLSARRIVDGLSETGMPNERWVRFGDYGYYLEYSTKPGIPEAWHLYRCPWAIIASYPPGISSREIRERLSREVHRLEETYSLFYTLAGCYAAVWLALPALIGIPAFGMQLLFESIPASVVLSETITFSKVLSVVFLLPVTLTTMLGGALWYIPWLAFKCLRGRRPARMRAALEGLGRARFVGAPDRWDNRSTPGQTPEGDAHGE